MDRPCIKCHQYFDIREHRGNCPNCNFDNFNQSTRTNNVSIKTEKINMKKFKDNQKVRHPKYGEGTLVLCDGGSQYYVIFKDVESKLKLINDDFYNQLERVEDLPEVGEYAYFWDDDKLMFFYGIFKGRKLSKYKYEAGNNESAFGSYQNISKTPPKFD